MGYTVIRIHFQNSIKVRYSPASGKGRTTSRVLRCWLDGWNSAGGPAGQRLQAHRMWQMLTDGFPRIVWAQIIFNTCPNFDLMLARQQ